MAISTNTESLISLYQQEISLSEKQIEQVQYTENGFTVPLPDGGEYKLYADQESIDYFTSPTQKLDKKIIEINNKIVGLQNTLLQVGLDANDCGCGGLTGFSTSGAFPFIYTPFVYGPKTTVNADTTLYRGYTYTSPNPFEEVNGTLTTGNAGIGTESIFGVSFIGDYYSNIGVARTTLPVCPGVTNCAGYATSETNLNAQIATLQAERNALAGKVNILKDSRSEFEVKKYGLNASKEELNAQIASSNSIISFLKDPANEQWL